MEARVRTPDDDPQDLDQAENEYEPPRVEYLGTLREMTAGAAGPGADNFVTGVS